MTWDDTGFLLSTIRYNENSIIAEIFTKNHGKVSGIIFGGTSKKIKNYLQVGNQLYLNYNSKSENRIGYFKAELVEAISPKYFNDKKKTTALLSLSSILNLLLPESQPYKNLYISLDELLKNFDKENWVNLYIDWELKLLKELGFDPFLEQFVSEDEEVLMYKTIEIDNINYQVPTFLLSKTKVNNLENKQVSMALSFTRSILTNKFFFPNNLSFPKSRMILENYFN